MGKWAHGKLALIVATCIASMPPLKAHMYTIPCGKIGASLGWEANQVVGHKVACL
jgi:hypothetical protein